MKTLLLILSAFAFNALCAQNLDSAQFYFQKGMVEKNAKRFLTASQYFDKSISFDASNTEVLLEDAFTYKEMRKIDQARALFLKVYQINPTDKIVVNELMNI